MGKNALTYVFTETSGDGGSDQRYVADNGRPYSVSSRASINSVITADIIGSIVQLAGGRVIPDGVKAPKCQNRARGGWMDPRFIEWVYTVGGDSDAPKNGKIRIAFRDRNALDVVATGGREAIEGSGAKVHCINLIGEDFLNIVYNLDIDELPDPTASVRFAPFIYSGFYPYDSDTGLEFEAPFRIASDVEKAPPTGFPQPACFTPREGLVGRCRPPGKRKPRHMVVSTVVQETMEKQKTILPLQFSDAETILQCQRDMANSPIVTCLRYRGESYRGIERLL